MNWLDTKELLDRYDKMPYGFQKSKFKAAMTLKSPFRIALKRHSKEELVYLLMDFKEEAVKQIQEGYDLDYPSKRLFNFLCYRARINR